MFYLKRTERSAIKAKPGPVIPYTYWIFVGLRFFLACIPQNGYIHPDEFFQTVEPIAGDILEIDVRHCWEFNVTFPLRNNALSRVAAGIPLNILLLINAFTQDIFHINLITTYFVLIFPRLCYCLLSLVNDYCLYKICRLYGQNYRNRLLALGSSYIMLVYATHTFSNALEMMLVSLIIWLVSDCMMKSDSIIYHKEYLSDKYRKSKNMVERVNIYKLTNSLPAHSLSKCLQIASISVVGFFNRPTFIGFAFPAVFFWLVRGLGTKYVGFKDFHYRIIIFMLSTIPGICCMILFDSFYYGYLTWGEVHNLKVSINNFVVTPLNFFKYNMFSENLSQHGLHPRWLHIIINVPILFNVLGVVAIVSVIRILYRLCKGSYSSMPKVKSITGLMIFSFVTPVAILSLFPHQEPRFLIPIILPVIFLFTHVLQKTESDSKLLKKMKTYAFIIWSVCNIFLTLFFGFIHQGGIYHVARFLQSELKVKPRATVVHLVTSHIYDIPQSFFLNPSTTKLRTNRVTKQKYYLSKQFFLYELGGKPLDDVVSQVKAVWKVSEMKQKHNFRLYLALPSSLVENLGSAWLKSNASSLVLKEEMKFFPHLSSEAFPYFPGPNDQNCRQADNSIQASEKLDLTIFKRFTCFIKQFSLVLYKVDIASYLTIDNYDSEESI